MRSKTKPHLLEEAEALLSALEEEAPFTFQVVPEREGGPPPGVYHGTLAQVAPLLAGKNRRGAGVYFVPNATDGRGRRRENVVGVRALFVDLDGAPLEPVVAWLPPTAVVETSPGRYHAYWRVKGVGLEDFRPAQERLALRFGGDPAPKDLGRAMRLPGTWNWKREKPFLARLVSLSGNTYARQELEEAFPGLFAPLNPPRANAPMPLQQVRARPGLLRWLGDSMAAAREGERHRKLYSLARLAGGWVAAGAMEEREALETLVAAAVTAGLPRQEATRTARDGMRDGLAAPLLPPEREKRPCLKRVSVLPLRPPRTV